MHKETVAHTVCWRCKSSWKVCLTISATCRRWTQQPKRANVFRVRFPEMKLERIILFSRLSGPSSLVLKWPNADAYELLPRHDCSLVQYIGAWPSVRLLFAPFTSPWRRRCRMGPISGKLRLYTIATAMLSSAYPRNQWWGEELETVVEKKEKLIRSAQGRANGLQCQCFQTFNFPVLLC